MLERGGGVEEHCAIDGECRGSNCASNRDNACDDEERSAPLTGHSRAIIRWVAT
jgi:hypothetical protein